MSDPFEDVPGADDYLMKVFGPEGYLAKQFPEYQMRSGQVALTKAIDDAIGFREHLMAEGPCGTGKSLAYLVPLSYYVAETREKVIVVTANIALQEQLVTKDLPLLSKILPWRFSFGLLKGKNNFLCCDKFIERDEKGFQNFAGERSDWDELQSVRQWGHDQMRDEDGTGDMSDLDFQPTLKVWREFSVSADECKGSDCRFYKRCFAVKAQTTAREKDIIVTNYHLLFSHIKLKLEAGVEVILPPFNVAVLDESHKASDIARDFLGFRITREMFCRAANGLRGSIYKSLVEKHATELFEELHNYRKGPRYKTRIKEPLLNIEIFEQIFNSLCDVCNLCIKEYRSSLKELDQKINQLEPVYGADDPSVEELKNSRSSHMNRMSRLLELVNQTDQILRMETSDQMVYFIELEGKREYTVLGGKPISVASTLSKSLFKETNTVICTSATLSTGGNFDFVAGELGCVSYSEIIAESPFQWEEQALLVLPDMTDPTNREEFPLSVAEKVAEIVELSQGRALALFTSHKNLDIAFQRLRGHPKFKILKQGDGNRTKLIEQFKKDTSSVLLGTESFWAGVDVPGDSLSVVIIDRIPFPQPDDPVLDALAEANPKGFFYSYSIPKAIITLKQGFGRLVRSVSDRGVVVILDNRLLTKSYGKLFLRSLPPVRIDTDARVIGPFLDRRQLTELSDEEFLARAFA